MKLLLSICVFLLPVVALSQSNCNTALYKLLNLPIVHGPVKKIDQAYYYMNELRYKESFFYNPYQLVDSSIINNVRTSYHYDANNRLHVAIRGEKDTLKLFNYVNDTLFSIQSDFHKNVLNEIDSVWLDSKCRIIKEIHYSNKVPSYSYAYFYMSKYKYYVNEIQLDYAYWYVNALGLDSLLIAYNHHDNVIFEKTFSYEVDSLYNLVNLKDTLFKNTPKYSETIRTISYY